MILKIRYFINHDFVIHFLYVLLVNYLFDTQSTYLFRFMYFNKMPWNRKLCGTYHATHLNVNFILFLIGISFWNYQMLSCHQVYFDQVYRVTFFWLRNKIVQILHKQMQKHFHDYFSHFWKRSRKFFPHSCVQPISARTQPPNYSADVCYLLLHQPRNSSMPVSSISRKNIKLTQIGFRIR